MAKKAAGKGNSRGDSVGGYFRQLFNDNPHFLQERSNDEVMRRWAADHPKDKEPVGRIRNILANVKSTMRKELREAGSLKAPKQRQARPAAAMSGGEWGVEKTSVSTATASDGLELLEEAIDDCLTLAKNLDREHLANVIGFLRRARNLVVWKLGE
jgi:hypothetical protein